MRNNLSKNVIITNPQQFYALLENEKFEIQDIIMLDDNVLRVVYANVEEYVEENSSSNVVVSLITTDAARKTLYKYMSTVSNSPFSTLLYTDTDSVIFKFKKGHCPLEEGMFLGEMSREYKEFEIMEYTGGGPKQYSMLMRNRITNEIKSILKIRGITLNFENCSLLNYESFKKRVLNSIDVDPILLHYKRIQPTRTFQIITRDQTKKYEPVCTKGIILKNYIIIPFGFDNFSILCNIF